MVDSAGVDRVSRLSGRPAVLEKLQDAHAPLLVIRAMDFSWLRHSANPASTSRSIRARCFCCSGLMPKVAVEIMLPKGSADISFRISMHFGSRRRLASSLGSGNNPRSEYLRTVSQDRAVRPSILR